jgi:hypothetical protein
MTFDKGLDYLTSLGAYIRVHVSVYVCVYACIYMCACVCVGHDYPTNLHVMK